MLLLDLDRNEILTLTLTFLFGTMMIVYTAALLVTSDNLQNVYTNPIIRLSNSKQSKPMD